MSATTHVEWWRCGVVVAAQMVFVAIWQEKVKVERN
jgi:hypothetical protein